MKIFKIFALSLFSFSLLFSQMTNAEEKTARSLGVDHFEVILPKTAKVGEAVDLTIKAVDKNGTIVPEYNLPVLIFSTTDALVELPISLNDSRYTFKTSNQGEVTFENGVVFSKEGEQDLYVYDEYTDTTREEGIGGGTKIIISNTKKIENKLDINIVSPEPNVTITENKLRISGNTTKNHQVKVYVNNKDYGTVSNSEGIYEVEANELKNGDNTIKAQVLDGDNKVVGESDLIHVKVEKKDIEFKSIKLTPEEVFSEALYDIEVVATPKLSKVNIDLNDEVITLEEKEDGVYIQKASAPQDKGTYNLNITLKDETGGEIKEFGIATLKVKELNSPLKKEEKVENTSTGETVTETGSTDKQKETGVVLNSGKEELDSLDIKGLKLVELKTKSILTWDKVDKADSYNIYKKNTEGKFELVVTVHEPKFEVVIDHGEKEKYDYFAVRAVGKTSEGKEYEGNLSDATKVKTGPEMIILLIISLIIGVFLSIFFLKKKA